jgi:hypothetical protein
MNDQLLYLDLLGRDWSPLPYWRLFVVWQINSRKLSSEVWRPEAFKSIPFDSIGFETRIETTRNCVWGDVLVLIEEVIPFAF